MKVFIFKIGLFVIPFLLLYFLNFCFYKLDEGDLAKLGYIYSNPSPKNSVSKQFNLIKKFKDVSQISLDSKTKFDVLTIGDSFSDQDSLGYINFLAMDGVSALNINRYIYDSPIQTLIGLINSDFFDSVQVKHVVLQSIERLFVERCQEIDFSTTFPIDTIKSHISSHKIITPDTDLSFFSNTTIRAPLTNIAYSFYSKPKYSKIYKVSTTTDNLFSGSPNNLLFYEQDIDNIEEKNDTLKIDRANYVISKINDMLLKKNIDLILLISPDKYDLYYPYIKNNQRYTKPLFFSYFNNLKKEYKYVNSSEILSSQIKVQKDVYYYDDTHWTPIGAKIIANGINKLITD